MDTGSFVRIGDVQRGSQSSTMLLGNRHLFLSDNWGSVFYFYFTDNCYINIVFLGIHCSA